MKESLKLLNVESAGFEDVGSASRVMKVDEDILAEAKKISDLTEQESFLRKILEKDPFGYVSSKCYLATLVKNKDPKYACDLILSACQADFLNPNNYLIFAEIAAEHKAWLVARDTLMIVKWLCSDASKDILEKLKSLNTLVLESIKNKVEDNSKDKFWSNKSPDKYSILLKLHNRSKIKKVIDYSFKLLDVFPEDKENYETVIRALSLTQNREAINRFIEYVQKNLSADIASQNLYLGIAYHFLSDFDTSLSYLQEVLKKDVINPNALYYLALNFLIKNDLKNFVSTFNKIIPPPKDYFIALYFISGAISSLEIKTTKFPDQKNISREVTLVIKKLLQNKQDELAHFIIKQFKKLNYYSILEFLQPNLAELFIRDNCFDHAREVLKDCTDFEVYRLNAWMYRLEGKEDLAEEELVKYRKSWIPDKDSGIFPRPVDLNLPDKAPDDIEQIFKFLESAYSQAKEMIHQFSLEYGLNIMTCIETVCQDCCKKTFPAVTYTEYLYMRYWLEKQSEEFKNDIYKKSNEIVNLYRERYKKDPPFVCNESSNIRKEYPYNFTFTCPYLGDNKCNIYEARPFDCRSYGYGTDDGFRHKSCKYFFDQVKAASRLTLERKAINIRSFFEFAKLTDEKLIGRRIVAPIPVWFAQSHEETLKKINNDISKSS
ncbi:MAG: YkgJ family cysteine cluster protein [Candidatus Melainabacteria bacterium]|nr:YkgJ family cysteine cluster protein [Candidatus Melainabacteria bacterium]